MKKLIAIVLAGMIIQTGYAQQIETVSANHPNSGTTIEKGSAYYFQKSKDKKTAAWAMVGAGGGLVLIGFATFPKDYSWWGNSKTTESKANISAGIAGVGGLLMLGSIPFFVSSGKAKRKAKVLVENEKINIPGAASVNQTNMRLLVSF